MNSPKLASSITSWPFVGLALVWLAGAYFAGQQVATLPFGFVVVSVFIFAVPIALSGAYSSAVDQTRDVSYYESSGWAYKFLSRRLLRTIVWVVWALTSSIVMLLQFHTYSGLEWMTLFLVIPVYWLVYSKSHQLLSRELRKRYVLTSLSIEWTRWVCPTIMLAVYAVLIWSFPGVQEYASLSEALAVKRSGIPERTGSAVVQVGLQLMTFADGIKAYLVGGLKQFGEYLPLLLTILGSYVVFFNASATFACFVIPGHEYRRIFGPISDDDLSPPLPESRILWSSALITFFALFVYVPLFAYLENWIGGQPKVLVTIKTLERKVERIDDALYNPGTIQKLEAAKAVALGKLNVSRAILEGQIDRAFDRMEEKVNSYLDWYYSLPAEYMRLAMLMTGKLEGYMKKKLGEMLQESDAIKDVSNAITSALASHKSVMEEYQRAVKAILDANRLAVPVAESTVGQHVSLNDILALPTHLDVVAFDKRVAGGAVAGGVSAAVTAKIVSKGVFTTAAKALSKVAISKAAGVLGGTAVGATIGSFVPVIGTVIGGALGAVLGGLAGDAALLTLEELLSRKEFKAEILVAIQEARVEYKSRVLPKQ